MKMDKEALAREAIQSWGGGNLTLIGERENTVFRAELNNGKTAALRLHRPGYQSDEHIKSEMIWTENLAVNDFPCPQPIPTKAGDLLTHLSNGQIATAVGWIDAEPIGAHGRAFDGTADKHAELYLNIGKLVRRLHKLTDQLDLNIKRSAWDLEGTLGEAPLWGRFWENPSLTDSEATLINDARLLAQQHLISLEDADFGLIHADIMQENILIGSDDLFLIDFDDCGFGYRLFDLGTALIQHTDCRYKSDLKSAICEGYGCAENDIDLFIMLRSMASAGWIISRASTTDPKQRVYVERMLSCVNDYNAG